MLAIGLRAQDTLTKLDVYVLGQRKKRILFLRNPGE